MTPQQKFLVQSTFKKISPSSEEVAARFYDRLFSVDPTVKPLFRGDLEEQGRKLIQMLAVAVHGLDRLDQIVPAVQALGQRHIHYGVKAEHYDTVGTALLWTLEHFLGADFTPEAKKAWATAYSVLADTMKNAMAKAA
jgi:hemoglobin-like flavoprotein